jgi:hypothetical protein
MASDQRPPRAQSPLQTQAQPKQTPRALGPSPLDESPARQWSALAALGPAWGPGLLLLAAELVLGRGLGEAAPVETPGQRTRRHLKALVHYRQLLGIAGRPLVKDDASN